MIVNIFSCRMEGTGDSPLVDMRTEINGPSEDGKFKVSKINLFFPFLVSCLKRSQHSNLSEVTTVKNLIAVKKQQINVEMLFKITHKFLILICL